MASTAAAKAGAADAGAPPKKSKTLLIIVLAVVLLAGGGGAAWFFMKDKAAAEEEETPKPANKPAVFVPLDQFTVNLQQEEGQQFLQTAMTLKVVDSAAADAIKAHMPEVRSKVLMLLSSRKPSQVLSVAGKTKLAADVARVVENVIAPPKAKPAKKSKKKAKDEEAEADADDEAKAKRARARAREEEEEDEGPRHVLDVLFTHFIVQ